VPELSTELPRGTPAPPRAGRISKSAATLSAAEIAALVTEVALEVAAEVPEPKFGRRVPTTRHENPHLVHDPQDKQARQYGMTKRAYGTSLARFANAPVTESVKRRHAGLDPRHPALKEGRTVHTAFVFDATQRDRVLISGINNAKLGRLVTKGLWAGSPIYHLSLEERKTCPRSCPVWDACLVPETPVLTADLRWIPLGDVRVGDRLMGFDEGRDTSHRTTKVAIVEAEGLTTKNCYRIVTDQGTVIASDDHLWLQRRTRSSYHWRTTERLKPGDNLQFFSQPWTEEISYNAARLRGFVEGEGYCCTFGPDGLKTRVGWAQRPSVLADEIKAIAQGLGFDVAEGHRVGGAAHTAINHYDIRGGWRAACEFVGRIRPTRFIEKAEELWLGHELGRRSGRSAKVLSIEPVGNHEVVKIQTSTRTMVAGGFFTHNCYGNGMPAAVRFRYNANLMRSLQKELAALNERHPNGFVVRLHVLGDFPDLDYVKAWIGWSNRFRALQVEGYTAHARTSEIGQAIWKMNLNRPKRWQIRNSVPMDAPCEPMQVSSLWDGANSVPDGIDGIVCPQELGKTQTCGTCALCWSPAMADKRVLFLGHGGRGKK